MPIDATKPARSVGIAVVTVSDTRTEETDTSGRTLVERLQAAGHRLAGRCIVKDDTAILREVVLGWCADPDVDVVIATGGTGLTGRDITPEVFEPLYDKPIPGFGELFRMLSFKDIGTSTLQSRASAGLVGTTLFFCLPGSPKACRLAWDEILVHQLDSRHSPCNLVELMPRFKER